MSKIDIYNDKGHNVDQMLKRATRKIKDNRYKRKDGSNNEKYKQRLLDGDISIRKMEDPKLEWEEDWERTVNMRKYLRDRRKSINRERKLERCKDIFVKKDNDNMSFLTPPMAERIQSNPHKDAQTRKFTIDDRLFQIEQMETYIVTQPSVRFPNKTRHRIRNYMRDTKVMDRSVCNCYECIILGNALYTDEDEY